MAIFAAATLIVVLGFIALGSLSPADPEATATSTTTTTTIEDLEPPVDPEDFSVAQIATGEPLEWQPAQTVPTGYPIELLEHDGDFYLFATRDPPWQAVASGLIAWRSPDGLRWEALGQVIGEEFTVAALSASPSGFAAAGSRTNGQELIVWRSENAIDWSATVVPTEAEAPYERPHASAVGMTEGAIVVAGNLQVDVERIIEDHLSAQGIVTDLSQAVWTTQSAGDGVVELSVYGPLIFPAPALNIPLSELDLTDQERRWITGGLAPNTESSVWVVENGGTTTASTIPLSNVSEIVARGTGGLVALGHGGAGRPVGLSSSDGVDWSPTAESPTPAGAEDRETFLVGYSEDPAPELLYSMLGGTWREMGISDEFPLNVTWTVTAFGGGEKGVVMAFAGRDRQNFDASVERGTTTITNSEGVRLTLDYEQRLYLLEEGGGTIRVVEMAEPGATETPGGLEIDLEEQIVAFTDPESGETLAEFGFEELQRAETRLRQRELSDLLDPRHKGLVINTGALDWRVADVSQTISEGMTARAVEMSSERVVLIVDEILFGPSDSPGFEIWTAELP